MHGFDEFFGNLYPLNAEEDPEMESYQAEKDIPGFKEKFGPRGILHSWATEEDDPTEEPRWGRVGKQRIEDTGPLNRKRIETVDDEFAAAAMGFMNRATDSTPATCISSPTPNPKARARPAAGSPIITTPWSTMTN